MRLVALTARFRTRRRIAVACVARCGGYGIVVEIDGFPVFGPAAARLLFGMAGCALLGVGRLSVWGMCAAAIHHMRIIPLLFACGEPYSAATRMLCASVPPFAGGERGQAAPIARSPKHPRTCKRLP